MQKLTSAIGAGTLYIGILILLSLWGALILKTLYGWFIPVAFPFMPVNLTLAPAYGINLITGYLLSSISQSNANAIDNVEGLYTRIASRLIQSFVIGVLVLLSGWITKTYFM